MASDGATRAKMVVIVSAQSLNGVWSYRNAQFPDWDDFMWIDEARKRIVTFVVMAAEPLQYAPVRKWYRPESANSISIRLDPAKEWRVHHFTLRGDILVWIYGGAHHPWKRLSLSEHPQWLETKIAAAYLKMDERERCA